MMMDREATDSCAVSTECRRMRRPNARYRRADPRLIAPPDLLRHHPLRPNSRVQVTPLARPVNRGVQEYVFRAVSRSDQEICQRRT